MPKRHLRNQGGGWGNPDEQSRGKVTMDNTMHFFTQPSDILFVTVVAIAGGNKTKLVSSPVSLRPHTALERPGFEGNGGNSYAGHLSLPQRPDRYSSLLVYLLTKTSYLHDECVSQLT